MAEQTEQATPNEGELRREVGLIPLLFSSVGAIIGSGWLFGALYATIEAGPAAIFSWLIAGGVILLLALIHAELGGMFPLTGGTARYPQFAYGSVVSFAAGWIAWVGAVTIRTDRGAGCDHLCLRLPPLACVGHGRRLRPVELSGRLPGRIGAHAPIHGCQSHGGKGFRQVQRHTGVVQDRRAYADHLCALLLCTVRREQLFPEATASCPRECREY